MLTHPQYFYYYQAHKRIADANETFLAILPTLTRKELQALIAKRPEVYGKYAGYLDKLP